jgi:hypothetical protein
VQLIAACAEYPPARCKFEQCLSKLYKMKDELAKSQPLVSEHAKIAIQVIEWKP